MDTRFGDRPATSGAATFKNRSTFGWTGDLLTASPRGVATVLHGRGAVVIGAVYCVGHAGGESYAYRDRWRAARPEGRSPARTACADGRHFPETTDAPVDAPPGAALVEH